ncbi:hypothetical protein [Vampirovibrio chlorellavorus]|uniref:hypothetical protein n=1 Tax=Vampirovibrio chlorellavorus TaxID=758823 RepID=UPI0026E9E8AE|nr:hypothetical protein [Vampirovibrio chlorellavorus]
MKAWQKSHVNTVSFNPSSPFFFVATQKKQKSPEFATGLFNAWKTIFTPKAIKNPGLSVPGDSNALLVPG